MATKQLYAFGCANNGQLGFYPSAVGTSNAVTAPQNLIAVPVGDGGTVVKSIASGEKHSLFLTDNGQVWSCGGNDEGQLGRGGTKEGSGTIYPVMISRGIIVTQIAAGCAHSMAVCDDGRLLAWGSNRHGQLAKPEDVENCGTPQRVTHVSGIVQVACGSTHTVAISDAGCVFIWGEQANKKMYYIPIKIDFFSSMYMVQVAAGNLFTYAVTASGALYAWGKNDEGQLGISTTQDTLVPQEVKNVHSVVAVACGYSHAVALTYQGQAFACGSDTFGQLGCGKRKSCQTSMINITEMLGSHITRVACGRCHTVLLASGKMYTCGLNTEGQLGHGNLRIQITPRIVDAVDDVVTVFAGWDQTFCFQMKTVHTPDILSGPSCFLQRPKYLSYRIIEELFKVGEKLSILDCLQSVFSSLPSINGSFLFNNENRYRCSMHNSCVDLDQVVQSSSIISANCDADQFADLIIHCLELSGLMNADYWKHVVSQESFRVFLIIPSLYIFSKPSIGLARKFHLPFMKSMLSVIHAPQTNFLVSWWSVMAPRHFNRLVTSLVKTFEKIIEGKEEKLHGERMKIEDAAYPFCSILYKLYLINKEKNLIPYDKFYLNNLSTHVNVKADYNEYISQRAGSVFKPFFWSKYPFLLNTDLKITLIQFEIEQQRQRTMFSSNLSVMNPYLLIDPFMHITVRRDHIVEDAIHSLLSNRDDVQKPLKVTFQGEEGDDAGGVRKEFFMLLFQELLSPKYGLFVENEDSHLAWFSGVQSDPLSFKLVGALCGLAMYNNVLLDFPFPLALYKKILHVPLDLDDLTEYSPSEGRSLQALLDYEEPDLNIVFALNFVITLSLFDDQKDVELKPGGAEIEVNQSNKHEFVQLYIRKKMEEGYHGEIARQLEPFKVGFDLTMRSHLFGFLQPRELMEMIVGYENYDWNIFRENTEYRGVYHANHETIRCFWEVFFEWSIDERKKFLQFLMGSTRIPIQGMSEVKMVIQPSDEKFLPVAHTCFNILDLPDITDHAEMRRRLAICLENTHGFTLV